MSETEKNPDGTDYKQPDWRPVWNWINTTGFWLLLVFGCLLIAAIILLAFAAESAAVTATILAAGIPAVLTFVVVVIQAVVSKQMSVIMERQETEMTQARIVAQEQRDTMRDQLAEMKAQTDHIEDSVKATDEIKEQNERSMMNSQAAYIMMDDLSFARYQVGEIIMASVAFTNTGTTPAYDVRIYAHLDYQKVPFAFTHEQAKDLSGMNRDKGKIEATPTTIGPNGDVTTQEVMTGPLNAALLELEKTEPLHFWGLVTYMDIFGRERWTEFSYRKVVAGEVIPASDAHHLHKREQQRCR